jgi:neutral ceramidase
MSSSTCNNRSELCAGRGPGWPDHFASTLQTAQLQLAAARHLFDSATVPLHGRVDWRHTYVDMTHVAVNVSAAKGE